MVQPQCSSISPFLLSSTPLPQVSRGSRALPGSSFLPPSPPAAPASASSQLARSFDAHPMTRMMNKDPSSAVSLVTPRHVASNVPGLLTPAERRPVGRKRRVKDQPLARHGMGELD